MEGWSLHKCFSNYMVASYLYYVLDESMFTDTEYDLICKRLWDEWENFEHQHKRLVTKEDLDAGSGFAIPVNKYPKIVCMAALGWLDENKKDSRYSQKSFTN